MVATKSFLFILLVSNFRFGTSGVTWSFRTCESIDTDEIIGRVTNSTDNETPSSLTPCLSLCCNEKEAQGVGRTCEKDFVSDSDFFGRIRIRMENGSKKEVSGDNFHLQIHDPCEFEWMVPTILKNFYLLPNGSLRDLDGGLLWDFEHYCLYRNPESVVYTARVCRPWIMRGIMEICSAIVVILILTAIFVVYSVVPELKNLHGLIYRSYLATYIAVAVFALGVELTTELKNHSILYLFFEFCACSACGSCMLWLNVMSYNIWRSVRTIQAKDFNSKEDDKKAYRWYALYAWSLSAASTAILYVLIIYLRQVYDEVFLQLLKTWTMTAAVFSFSVLNVMRYVSTALKIRAHKTDTAKLQTNGVSKHHAIAEQWFNLYLKLFFIMGGNLVVWSIWIILQSPIMTYILSGWEIAQAILIFFIFVWKDNVRRSFSERFKSAVTSRLSSRV